MQVTIDYNPRPKQELFHKSAATECLFGGAKSPGKSCALTMEAVAYALQYPKSTPYLFRSTFDDLDANLIQEFKNRVPQECYTFNESKHEAYLDNGSTIKFRYISSVADAFKYNGRSIPWIGVDELTEHEEKEIQILLSCNRSAGGFPVRFRGTANPGNKGHKWVYKRYIFPTDYGKKGYIDAATGNHIQFIPATVYDGVLAERDPAYVKRLENLPETEKQAYLYGNWDIFEGQFFSDFGVHNRELPFIIPPQDNNERLIAALDHGIAHDTSFSLAYLPKDNSIHTIFSYDKNGGTTASHAEAICEQIESCRFSHRLPPCAVFYDYAMDTMHRLSEYVYRSDLDEYRDAFARHFGKDQNNQTVFIPANKRKVDGCHDMKSVFAIGNGNPVLKFFTGMNDKTITSIETVLTDKLNPEIYSKMDGDDGADKMRYLVMGALAKQQQLNAVIKAQPRPIPCAPVRVSTGWMS